MDSVRGKNLVKKLAKFGQPGAWDNDSVAPSVGFFRDTEKPPAIIFAKFDKKVFAFDLEFS